MVAHATVDLSDRPVLDVDTGFGNGSGVNSELAGINNSPAQGDALEASHLFTIENRIQNYTIIGTSRDMIVVKLIICCSFLYPSSQSQSNNCSNNVAENIEH